MAVVGTVVVGQGLVFGVTSDVASTVTQKVSLNLKSDRKEARDKRGTVIAAAYYNRMNDISVDFLGIAATTPGTSITTGLSSFTPIGTVYADEISHNQDNQDFEGGTIKATAWEGIPGT